MIVHDLKERVGTKLLTRCGVTTGPDGGDTTVWASDVTCSACQAKWVRPPQRKRQIKRRATTT